MTKDQPDISEEAKKAFIPEPPAEDLDGED
jgi:hypothetical protein